MLLFLDGLVGPIVIVALHCVDQVIYHVLPLLASIPIGAILGHTNSVLTSIQLELWSVLLLHSLAVFELVVSW